MNIVIADFSKGKKNGKNRDFTEFYGGILPPVKFLVKKMVNSDKALFHLGKMTYGKKMVKTVFFRILPFLKNSVKKGGKIREFIGFYLKVKNNGKIPLYIYLRYIYIERDIYLSNNISLTIHISPDPHSSKGNIFLLTKTQKNFLPDVFNSNLWMGVDHA